MSVPVKTETLNAFNFYNSVDYHKTKFLQEYCIFGSDSIFLFSFRFFIWFYRLSTPK